jgi:plastocyanin
VTRRTRLALSLLAASAVLSACGDEPVAVEGRQLQIRLDEYRIEPQNLKVAEGRLRIVATNVGRLTHNLKVVKQDPDDLEALPEEIGGTRTAQPGETTTITFEDLAPGKYRLVCTLGNHDDLGQYGSLEVVEQG